MKNSFFTFVFIIAFSFVSFPANAGKWIQGQGITLKAAIEDAKKKAIQRVKKRKKGCVDGKTRNPLKQTDGNGNEYWTIEIYTHNHNGSCGN